MRAVQQLPKIFSLGEQHAFEVRFFRHGKKHRTRTAVLCNHDGIFQWQFLDNLTQLGLNFAKAFGSSNSLLLTAHRSLVEFRGAETQSSQR